jgi:hypothetical protein
MYLMYVDESGDTGLSGSPTRYFALSGIVVHESSWRDFINTLIAFRRALKTVYGLPVRAEMHASDMINHRFFNIEKHQRLAILRNTLDELGKMSFISITNVIVDKQGKPPTTTCLIVHGARYFNALKIQCLMETFPAIIALTTEWSSLMPLQEKAHETGPQDGSI